jgi:hypothetical protein
MTNQASAEKRKADDRAREQERLRAFYPQCPACKTFHGVYAHCPTQPPFYSVSTWSEYR